jgi:hypothetical protein
MEPGFQEKGMKKLNRMMEGLEREMAAVTFAEAGEADTAREILRERKTALLVLTGSGADVKALKYAASFCTRVGAALEILCSARSRRVVEQFVGVLEDQEINYSVNETDQCLEQAVIAATRKRRDIQYVVINSYEGLEKGCERDPEVSSHLWRLLNCPLVVVGA